MDDKLANFVSQLDADQARAFAELLAEWEAQLEEAVETEGFSLHRQPGARPDVAFSDPVIAVPGLMDTIKGWFSKGREAAGDMADKAG